MATAKKGTSAAKPAAKKGSEIVIPAIELDTLYLRLIGTSPLVCHAWSEKAKQELRDKHAKKAKTARGVRDPEAEFNAARYQFKHPVTGKIVDGFPACGIKRAMVDACSFVEGVTKVVARGAFHVNPGQELVPIECVKPSKGQSKVKKGKHGVEIYENYDPQQREDMVRVGGKGPGTGAADLRYRPEYPIGWSIPIEVRYNTKVVSAEQVVNLLNLAGFSIGLGEWRPQKDGDWGMFSVTADEVALADAAE